MPSSPKMPCLPLTRHNRTESSFLSIRSSLSQQQYMNTTICSSLPSQAMPADFSQRKRAPYTYNHDTHPPRCKPHSAIVHLTSVDRARSGLPTRAAHHNSSGRAPFHTSTRPAPPANPPPPLSPPPSSPLISPLPIPLPTRPTKHTFPHRPHFYTTSETVPPLSSVPNPSKR